MALSIDDIVRVTVILSDMPAPRSGFNCGLILGETQAFNAPERVRMYSNINNMLDDGYTASTPEYKAAAVYFSQSPKPIRVAIGRVDTNANESWLDAVTACCQSAFGQQFYMVYMCGDSVQDADIQSVAAYIETQMKVLVYNTSDVACYDGNTTTDIFSVLKSLSYERSLGLYSSNPYIPAAVMGYCMGANDGTANSAYTLAYKTLKGIAPEELSESQLAVIKGKNGNAYVQRGGYYNGVEQGRMANLEPFDTRLGLDQLANNIQLSVMDLLSGTKTKIPQTESGMSQIKTAIDKECAKAVHTRFLAPGVWNQEDLLSIRQGDTFTKGYVILSDPIDGQTVADRAARIAPAIYVLVKLAGAIEFVIIKVVVDR
ncbi:hypothetical protein FACS1894184_16320 [Clostridia bacterium]|nr:hypothetical protein FACS1894184_16320 [Clostridia bacterium]